MALDVCLLDAFA
ncbi:TPA: hypothetical protein LEL88_003602 [Vibrio cholerae]|uniref:Uncharacterized protein n=3 Tax=Vibrio TaxID=662 RepID=A0AAJ4IE82_9VIBR|nr:hypothetical protein [Vibrio cholerae]EIY8044400.1 hypothetical protein [Vibrio vulnificus]ELV8627266.1 hypothetical protein [Vibrio cidicii]KAA3490910.1 hypothetical protein Y058_19595 [Vibrio mimicus]MBU5841463.1 hypothetical protein [Vibrio cholerae O1]NVP29238.1 hypothetical protein [Vibrio cholerae O1 biovar El Tor]QJS94693.1 hypothetical protein GTF72_15290 [Vibrio cholerae C6706]QNE73087.1 hypothetical protein H6M50_16925 [Vibrio cholerae MO10]QPL55145.1 hypothetical protein I3X05